MNLTTVESGTGNSVSPFRLANRVHQRLLMSPMGEWLNKLHSWARKPGNKTQDLDEYEKDTLAINIEVFFARLFWIIYYLYKVFGVYHQDLFGGYVLVHLVNNRPYPLLTDFDHARLLSEPLNYNIHSRTGTVLFMNILHLAGRLNELSVVDELESLFYLWIWKCAVGFFFSHITRSKTSTNTSQVATPQLTSHSVFERASRRYATSNKPTATAQKSQFPVDETEQPSIAVGESKQR
ncbi:hypothetical protein IWQ62_005050 [Dispira parvispora]|uniref:Fungal-type protein kinase domain-containing protein n=1 Tax=Dispira parvispora TaxID=1520584 RepID=A0A9W8AKR0_9FUNG|nr:hypothetical protein IWQ62_005050 [Dispira parvispora]